MQMGFYFDQSRCIGCYACTVACKDWHSVSREAANWRRITTLEKGRFPDVTLSHLWVGCYHCLHPACAGVCPVNAIIKREEDGIVMVDREKCLGKGKCSLCNKACPYQIPQFGDEDNAKMQMCNFCIDSFSEGKKPICVDACPMRALDAGPIDQLRGKYGHMNNAEGFIYSIETNPSIIFKSRRVSQR